MARHASAEDPYNKKAPIRFKRGVSIHNAMNWPKRSENGSYLSPAFADAKQKIPVDLIAKSGFDFIRLTVNPQIFAESSGEFLSELYIALAGCIEKILDGGLNIILDVHAVAQDKAFLVNFLLDDKGGERRCVIGALRRFASILTRYPADRVALELWNEPSISHDRRAEWSGVQASICKTIREDAPLLTIIATGVGGVREGLLDLDPRLFVDPNVYYTFHYYEPMPFTHQGIVNAANKLNVEQFFASVPFPINPDDVDQVIREACFRAARFASVDRDLRIALVSEILRYEKYFRRTLDERSVELQFEQVSNWARTHQISTDRILLGEFGVMRPKVDAHARLRWISTIRREAERRGFAWCRWSFDNPDSMGMIDATNGSNFAKGELAALGM